MADKVDQSHQAKKAKVLSLGEQKKAVRGVKKLKGSKVIKSSLESPFALEWPKISVQEEEEVCQLFMQGCNGLQVKTDALPWHKIRNLPSEERKALKEQLRQNRKEAQCDVEGWRADLIMGYNRVMKAVERNEVVGVLVKKDAEPPFLVKAFLPGCATKGIPLLPVVALDKMVQSQEGLGLRHSCLVIGLRSSVTDMKNRFYPVYSKMCEILEVQQDDEEEEEGSDVEEKSQGEETKTKEHAIVKTHQLSEAEIAKYYLRRENKNERVFRPPGDTSESKENRKTAPDAIGFGADFISLGSGLTESQEERPPAVERTKTTKENIVQKIPETGESSTSFKDFMFLDAQGEDTDIPEGVTGAKKKKKKNKKRKPQKPGPEYKPAKIKKTMNDPNRKERLG